MLIITCWVHYWYPPPQSSMYQTCMPQLLLLVQHGVYRTTFVHLFVNSKEMRSCLGSKGLKCFLKKDQLWSSGALSTDSILACNAFSRWEEIKIQPCSNCIIALYRENLPVNLVNLLHMSTHWSEVNYCLKQVVSPYIFVCNVICTCVCDLLIQFVERILPLEVTINSYTIIPDDLWPWRGLMHASS